MMVLTNYPCIPFFFRIYSAARKDITLTTAPIEISRVIEEELIGRVGNLMIKQSPLGAIMLQYLASNIYQPA
jgi:hypothetical protein